MEIPLQVAVALLAIALLVDGTFVNVGLDVLVYLLINPCVTLVSNIFQIKMIG